MWKTRILERVSYRICEWNECKDSDSLSVQCCAFCARKTYCHGWKVSCLTRDQIYAVYKVYCCYFVDKIELKIIIMWEPRHPNLWLCSRWKWHSQFCFGWHVHYTNKWTELNEWLCQISRHNTRNMELGIKIVPNTKLSVIALNYKFVCSKGSLYWPNVLIAIIKCYIRYNDYILQRYRIRFFFCSYLGLGSGYSNTSHFTWIITAEM